MRSLLVPVLLFLMAAPVAGQTHLLVVTGLGGEPTYSREFYQLGAAMVDAAQTRYGLKPDEITFLAESPEMDPERIDGESTREGVIAELEQTAGRAGPNDAVFILLIGHGSSDSRSSRFNLRGPDLTAADLAAALDRFPTQSIVVVNTTSASGEFQKVLAGENRTIITATRSGLERNETVFGRYFVDAYAGDHADANKDGRISLLEAFDYAAGEVERSYKAEDALQSEHAVLSGDRELAGAFYLSSGAGGAPATASPELKGLLAERDRLQTRIDSLKAVKDQMDAEAYQDQLEELLVQLALKSREIRAQGGQ